jgi:hypothetical protein
MQNYHNVSNLNSELGGEDAKTKIKVVAAFFNPVFSACNK